MCYSGLRVLKVACNQNLGVTTSVCRHCAAALSCKCTQHCYDQISSWCTGLQDHPRHSEDVSFSWNCVFVGNSAFPYLPFHVVLHLLSWMKQRQVSYLHRTVLAKPISEEDVDWNVTNPSVLVWICMLIWSNGPSGDRAMEQFNHAISDRSSAAYLW